MREDHKRLKPEVTELIAAYCVKVQSRGHDFTPSREDFRAFCERYRGSVVEQGLSDPEPDNARFRGFRSLQFPL